jgi:hypothetical protein
MQAVRSVENTIITMEDLVKLGIVCWCKAGSDSVAKPYEEWISR